MTTRQLFNFFVQKFPRECAFYLMSFFKQCPTCALYYAPSEIQSLDYEEFCRSSSNNQCFSCINNQDENCPNQWFSKFFRKIASTRQECPKCRFVFISDYELIRLNARQRCKKMREFRLERDLQKKEIKNITEGLNQLATKLRSLSLEGI